MSVIATVCRHREEPRRGDAAIQGQPTMPRGPRIASSSARDDGAPATVPRAARAGKWRRNPLKSLKSRPEMALRSTRSRRAASACRHREEPRRSDVAIQGQPTMPRGPRIASSSARDDGAPATVPGVARARKWRRNPLKSLNSRREMALRGVWSRRAASACRHREEPRRGDIAIQWKPTISRGPWITSPSPRDDGAPVTAPGVARARKWRRNLLKSPDSYPEVAPGAACVGQAGRGWRA